MRSAPYLNPRLDLEWLVITALRENLTLIHEAEQASYNEAIRFARDNFSALFGKRDSEFRNYRNRNKDYERYLEEATARTRMGKEVTPEELIQKRIDEISLLLKAPENKKDFFTKLKNERRKLIKLLKEFEPRFTIVDENEALRADFSVNRPGLTYVDNHAGKFNVYKTNNDQQFVIRFLHPGTAEAATGVDLIYEVYNAERKRVRIVTIQYKIWKKGVLYFSQSGNLKEQLDKSQKCFCGKGYCDAPSSGKRQFRFPHCVPFLRPTDQIFNLHKLISSGWHIPVCQVEDRVSYSHPGGKILRLEDIQPVALNTEEFEQMFQQGMIGSRWLEADEVEDFYRQMKVLDPDEKIVIFSQKLLRNGHASGSTGIE